MTLITNYWGLDGMIVLTALMIAFYFYMTRNFEYWKKRGVLEVPPIPFVGNFKECIFLQKNPGHFMKELYEQAKGLPYIGFYVCDKPSLLIRDRELVKNILVKDFNYFSDRHGKPDIKDRLGYASLFFLKNPAWKILRTKLSSVFTSSKLKKMFNLLLVCAKNLETYLASLKLEGKGKIVGVKELAGKITTDMIASTSFGLDVNSLNDPDAEFRKYGKMVFTFNYIRGFEILTLFFLPNLARLAGVKLFGTQCSDFLRKVFWETINERIKSGRKRNDLIDILIEFKKTHSEEDIEGFKFDGDDLVAQAALFFIAGFDPSSTVMSFTLYELALHPEIQNKLRREIIQALNESHGEITYDMIMTLPYLDMVTSETLRMYPTLPFLDRTTVETYKVPNSDLVIKKGTPVYISMSGMHMDPEYFPDPKKYDPERFNEENKHNRPACVYFPFGEGPRACVGIRLGLLQTKLALVQFFSKYEVAPCEKTMIPMVLDPKAAFASPLGGELYLNVRKAESSSLAIN